VYSYIVCASLRFDMPEKKRTLAFVKQEPSVLCTWRTAHSWRMSARRAPVVTGTRVTALVIPATSSSRRRREGSA
jgi:hypothetical protein